MISRSRSGEKEKLLAQKLEAVGTLAGGVAHDFNNMLGPVLGYTQITLKRMEPDNPFRSYLNKIMDATRRTAGLTRQLLTFARKETVTPEVLNLNISVENMLNMLRRLIGENIQLDWQPADYDCFVKLDPTQFDQIITNLCINARDAITDIGRITIKTERFTFDEVSCKPSIDCKPGDYVRLIVSDNGSGMDAETQEHAFDPFFTTKKVGEGSGLGLAMVYGIIKQNNGIVTLYSELGVGTNFIIYLPVYEVQEGLTNADLKDYRLPQGRGETVLVVEDDPA